MRKNLGVQTAVFPMPVLMIAAYDENGTVNVMNAAWATVCDMDKIALIIDEEHKTTKNIKATKAFTVSIADKAHMDGADFFGIATGNKMPDKFANAAELLMADRGAFITGSTLLMDGGAAASYYYGSLKPNKEN